MAAAPTVESLYAQWVEAFNSHDLDRNHGDVVDGAR